MSCPGERPNTWHKHTSSEHSEATLYAKERQLVMNAKWTILNERVKKERKEKVWLTKKTWLHQWQIFNTLSKRKSNDDAKMMMLSANRMMAKAKAVMLKTQRMKRILVKTKNMKRIWNMMRHTNKKMVTVDKQKCQAILDEMKALDEVQGPEDGVAQMEANNLPKVNVVQDAIAG